LFKTHNVSVEHKYGVSGLFRKIVREQRVYEQLWSHCILLQTRDFHREGNFIPGTFTERETSLNFYRSEANSTKENLR
jgi:hypothetical protein